VSHRQLHKRSTVNMIPRVSIIVLNYNHPEVIIRLLDTLPMTTGVPYELVVVDNGSEPDVVAMLKTRETIDTLVLEPINHYFSEGNNIGVRHSNPGSEYILMLNSDIEILHPSWLSKMIEWMEGVPDNVVPFKWSTVPAVPSPGPRDIVSYGWSYDKQVPGDARLEGFCLLIRRTVWQDISPDFPFGYGTSEMICNMIKAGAKAGMLCRSQPYIRHHIGGSGKESLKLPEAQYKRQIDMKECFRGVEAETLDFTMGPDHLKSYLSW